VKFFKLSGGGLPRPLFLKSRSALDGAAEALDSPTREIATIPADWTRRELAYRLLNGKLEGILLDPIEEGE